MRSDKQIVASNRSSKGFELKANFRIGGVRGSIEGQYLECGEDALKLGCQTFRALLCNPKTKLSCDDDACADCAVTDFGDPLRDLTLGIADKIRDDVRVE